MIIQWGSYNALADDTTPITFPIPFPNSGLSGYITMGGNLDNSKVNRINNISKTQMSVAVDFWAFGSNPIVPHYWMVIGY